MKKVVILFVVAAMLLGFAGCNKKDSKEDKLKEAIADLNEDVFNDIDESNDYPVEIMESDDSETNESTVFGDYFSFEEAASVFETFSEFGYEYVTHNAGEEPTSWTFDYKYLGSETIDGVATEHYQVTMVEYGETKISEGWYDDTWSAVKYSDANGEQTGANAGWVGSTLTMMTQLYCNQTAVNLAIYSEDGVFDEFAYEMLDTESQDKDFGNGNTNVEIYNIKSKFADLIIRNGAAELNDKKFYVILETETADGSVQGLHITKAIPR